MAYLRSLQVGTPATRGTPAAIDPLDRAWTSAFVKAPVSGPIWLGQTNLHGDQQADLEHHGGPEKAVLCYSAQHYPLWQQELAIDIPFGGFGENFTVDGLREESVCLGDIYTVGEATVQVAQPRLPCWKIARRWRVKDLAARVQATGRTGWYLRVLAEGHVATGQEVTLVERPHPEWSIAEVNRVLHSRPTDFAAMQRLSECPLLAPGLRESLAARATSQRPGNAESRLYGFPE